MLLCDSSTKLLCTFLNHVFEVTLRFRTASLDLRHRATSWSWIMGERHVITYV